MVLIVNYLGFGSSSTHFWDFGGMLMGLNGNQLVLVIATFGGTDPFLGFWWCFDRVIVVF